MGSSGIRVRVQPAERKRGSSLLAVVLVRSGVAILFGLLIAISFPLLGVRFVAVGCYALVEAVADGRYDPEGLCDSDFPRVLVASLSACAARFACNWASDLARPGLSGLTFASAS